MLRRAFSYFAALILSLTATPVAAGEFTLQGGTDTAVIVFSGSVETGDLKKFQMISENARNATLILSSPGGRLAEGLKIGDAIRRKGYTTKVVGGSFCASACGFMWLAGERRVLEGDGKVGFHAAYKGDSDFTVSASGNAVAGAYMARLGLNDFVITYATEAAPREMRWLTPGDAKFIGLDVLWNSPSTVITSPFAMTRAEIEEAVISGTNMLALRNRFPKHFRQLVEAVYEAQSAGENWERVVSVSFNKLVPELVSRLASTASDSNMIEGAALNYRYLKRLQKTDPTMCASFWFHELFPVSIYEYLKATPDDLMREHELLMSKILASPVVNRRPLSKAERRYLERRVSALTPMVYGKLTIAEKKRFKNMKANRDSAMYCKLTIMYLDEIATDPKLEILTYRLDIQARE